MGYRNVRTSEIKQITTHFNVWDHPLQWPRPTSGQMQPNKCPHGVHFGSGSRPTTRYRSAKGSAGGMCNGGRGSTYNDSPLVQTGFLEGSAGGAQTTNGGGVGRGIGGRTAQWRRAQGRGRRDSRSRIGEAKIGERGGSTFIQRGQEWPTDGQAAATQLCGL